MITIEQLHKSFGERPVLKGIDLRIPEGQATGIVGPNGSGKTTVIKHMLGLVKADSGTITINGTVLNGNFEYRNDIGYMPQIARYPENMTARELIDFIRKVRESDIRYEIDLVDYFELQHELDKPLRTLSGGTRQKVGATLALMFDPQILILDEPTAGLDPRASRMFKDLIEREKTRGKTVLLTSHIMSEIEELTDFLIFVLDGKIKYHGPMEELVNEHREHKLEHAVAEMMGGVAQ